MPSIHAQAPTPHSLGGFPSGARRSVIGLAVASWPVKSNSSNSAPRRVLLFPRAREPPPDSVEPNSFRQPLGVAHCPIPMDGRGGPLYIPYQASALLIIIVVGGGGGSVVSVVRG